LYRASEGETSHHTDSLQTFDIHSRVTCIKLLN